MSVKEQVLRVIQRLPDDNDFCDAVFDGRLPIGVAQ
jgi:hypothetical protein